MGKIEHSAMINRGSGAEQRLVYLDTCMCKWYNYSVAVEIFFQISSIQLKKKKKKVGLQLFLLIEMPLNSTF